MFRKCRIIVEVMSKPIDRFVPGILEQVFMPLVRYMFLGRISIYLIFTDMVGREAKSWTREVSWT